ncbi:SDR family NAD(P)-dependent oxidoreductase [Papillibacter cinnamivorans]|uniref:Short-chain dehydrogenase n=1 Tax=Papillibacter cinnamivorans DSM 12816 TaxID=1122930 RepID=A0A1W2CKR4_9FIRM|nr:SDR family oxidoreductase [Papillibacter cinnamivorans]SMC85819.1 Short-chain dehydrogenase [Papillibacter cinnamivorans DSM 12816]
MELKGKRIVITGASSGLGREIMRRMLSAGARVVGVARNTEPIVREFGEKGAMAISCDVSDPRQLDAMLEEAKGLLGGIDIFFSNAGFGYYGPIGGADWEKIDKIFKTNVYAPIYTLEKLTEGGGTEPLTFVLTISGLGKMVLPGFTLYDSTKFALDGFVRTYRMEKPRNVKIVPVYPVALFTPFFKKAGGNDTPMPLMARQSPKVTAFIIEMGIRAGVRSIYPSLVFIIRCLLARVTPADVLVQLVEYPRFLAWKKRHGITEKGSD